MVYYTCTAAGKLRRDFYFHSGTHGIAEDIQNIKDPELKERADNLQDLIKSRWANSTNQKYQQAWKKWTSWCHVHPESTIIPAEPFYVSLYVNDMVINSSTPSQLDAAAAGIRWGHTNQGLPSPTDHILVKTVIEGGKRRTCHLTKKRQKEPFTAQFIKDLFDTYYTSKNSLHDRFLLTCLLCFTGFLRIEELQHVQIKDIELRTDLVRITIPKAKNDQMREGHVVMIARTSTKYCPVTWLTTYLSRTGLIDEPDAYLICRMAKTREGHKAIGHRPLSYTRIRENFLELISPLCGGEPTTYGLHSFRSGGASTASNNGISARLLGKHGRWKSEGARDRYIKDSEQKRLSVSKSLDL